MSRSGILKLVGLRSSSSSRSPTKVHLDVTWNVAAVNDPRLRFRNAHWDTGTPDPIPVPADPELRVRSSVIEPELARVRRRGAD